MKLCIRGDDFGFSKAVNYGLMETYEAGLLKTIGLMSNMEDAQHAWNLMKDKTDICLGLHVNLIVGKPCANPKDIPSLLREDQSFVTSKERRAIIKEGKEAFVLEEVYMEVVAQIERFQTITGRMPAYIDAHSVFTSVSDQAIDQAADAYGIAIRAHHFESDSFKLIQASFDLDAFYETGKANVSYFQDTLMYCDKVNVVVFHPGYLDMKVMNVSSLTINRCKDAQMLQDQEVIAWIQKHAELVRLDEQ